MANKTPRLGSVISGTLRLQELLPEFLALVRKYDQDAYAQMMLAPFGPIPAHADENENADWWEGDEAAALHEELTDLLQSVAPPYAYFGSHPGDGADFGFWLCEDWESQFDGLKVDDTSKVPADYSGEVLHVNDHGNTTLYSADKGQLSEIWSVV